MKRLAALCAAALCLSAVPSWTAPLAAQAAPGISQCRSDVISMCSPLTPNDLLVLGRAEAMAKALRNTWATECQRRGIAANSQQCLDWINSGQSRAATLSVTNQPTAPTNGRTWYGVLRQLSADLPWPLNIGKDGTSQDGFQGAPGFGGGGAGVQYGAPDCGDVKLELAADGSIIIPSYSLKSGGPISIGAPIASTNCTGCYADASPTTTYATTGFAALKWYIHRTNYISKPDKRDWFGTVGCYIFQGVYTRCTFANVPYRNSAGNVVARVVLADQQVVNETAGYTYSPFLEFKACPETQATGGTFDFYSRKLSGNSNDCHWYAPNYSLSQSGYIINDKTSIPAAEVASWPIGSTAIPAWQRACLVDPAFLAKLASKLWPGGDIPVGSARPGDLQVNDLGSDPNAIPNDPDNPTPDPNTPPPDPVDTGGSGGSTDKCDFEGTATGCTDPGTAAPEVSEWTNIFDPILNWLPDLPSITLPEMNTACPTWNINLTDYGGPSWQFLVNSHCQLVEKPMDGGGTVGSVLGNLMVAVFGIAAALIILRA